MNSASATILIVEDDHATRTFLAGNLSVDGFQVLEAANVLEALGIIESEFPDLAVVDLGLPDTDGLELLSEVRHSDRVAGTIDPELPLLVLTGRVGELDRLRGFERGCDDYVTKPSRCGCSASGSTAFSKVAGVRSAVQPVMRSSRRNGTSAAFVVKATAWSVAPCWVRDPSSMSCHWSARQ